MPMCPDQFGNSAVLRELVRSPDNTQAFADLVSPEANWQRMDTNITLPRHIGFAVEECPACLENIRLIYDKYAGCDLKLPLVCPHCKAELTCCSEFTGYTNEATLEEADGAGGV